MKVNEMTFKFELQFKSVTFYIKTCEKFVVLLQKIAISRALDCEEDYNCSYNIFLIFIVRFKEAKVH